MLFWLIILQNLIFDSAEKGDTVSASDAIIKFAGSIFAQSLKTFWRYWDIALNIFVSKYLQICFNLWFNNTNVTLDGFKNGQ